METKGKINLEKQKAEFDGKLEALYLSMNNNRAECDKWTKEEISGLKMDAFEEIFENVRELLGVKTDDEEGDDKDNLDDFPEN